MSPVRTLVFLESPRLISTLNNGTLPPQLKLNDLKKRHESYPRNKLIASVLYIRKFFEKWGSGTNKMLDLCRTNEVPEPEFEEYSSGFSVTFKFREPLSIKLPASVGMPHLNARQETILEIIKSHQSASIQQIIKELNDPPSQRMIQKDLRYLKEQGLVDLKGAGKKVVWILKITLSNAETFAN